MRSIIFFTHLVLVLTFIACSKRNDSSIPITTLPSQSDSLSVLIAKNTGAVKKILKDSSVENFSGFKEHYIDYLNKADKPIALYLLTVDLNNPKLSIAVGTPNNVNSLGSTQRVSSMITARNADEASNTVLAGINGDYFDFSTGIPLGPVHKNGVQLRTSISSGYKYFGLLDNGNYMIGGYDDYITYKDRLLEVIGGRHHLLTKGNVITQTDVSVAPRTTIGLRDFKKAVIMVADGRQNDHSVGLTLEECANILRAVGVKDAVNLDGGGSSVLVSKDKNTDKYRIKNKVSDGSERAVANALFIVQEK
ncbi:hypothetical protein BCY91_11150 [Pelobium manganitolerans]|uniref:Phosphodiester glycosidase domain-containing protein n=1 Tax=Pelobium manganitolerans TaxID=1842495 RepID=A0A419S252_9SPHI|nr:phosphodiester glycosidase family protein [Pelobium manganitolerans]RKD12798.1 hypothetical protein BCY91_11150 [Pelobium manganitolerans]